MRTGFAVLLGGLDVRRTESDAHKRESHNERTFHGILSPLESNSTGIGQQRRRVFRTFGAFRANSRTGFELSGNDSGQRFGLQRF